MFGMYSLRISVSRKEGFVEVSSDDEVVVEVYIKGKESKRNTDGQAEEVEEEVADIELLSEIVLFFLRFLSDWNEGSFVTANNKA